MAGLITSKHDNITTRIRAMNDWMRELAIRLDHLGVRVPDIVAGHTLEWNLGEGDVLSASISFVSEGMLSFHVETKDASLDIKSVHEATTAVVNLLPKRIVAEG